MGRDNTFFLPHLPQYPSKAIVTAVVTGRGTEFLSSLTGPLLVQGTVVPAWEVWREQEIGKL